MSISSCPARASSARLVALVALGTVLSGCTGHSDPSTPSTPSDPQHVTTIATPPAAGSWEMQAAIARGGRLYDRWMGETRPAPATRHPLYTATTEYADKPAVNWRCKECHGWDYRGRDGAYATGKRATGIVGIKRMVGADPAQVVTLLASPQHDFGTRLRTEELRDLALFVTQGQVDMTTVIDAKTKAVLGGDLVRGKAYYGTLCAQCHGEDGTKMKKMPAVGKLANDNPWETLHKILNGEPEEEMPALRALGLEVSRDILRYAQSLPQEKPAATAKP